MGAAGTKEPPRNVTFENQLLMTEAALQQLQSSVGKTVPQAVNPRSTTTTDSSKSSVSINNTNTPLPTIDTSGTVETWRALASSVNDKELQRLREDYKQKLIEQERYNREKLNLTKEYLASEVEKIEKKFPKYVYTPICELERSDIEQCYLANPKQVLKCSLIAEKFIQCVQQHRQQSLSLLNPQVNPITTNNTENTQQHTYVDPLSSKTSATADKN